MCALVVVFHSGLRQPWPASIFSCSPPSPPPVYRLEALRPPFTAFIYYSVYYWINITIFSLFFESVNICKEVEAVSN